MNATAEIRMIPIAAIGGILLAGALFPQPVASQEAPSSRFHLSADLGASLHDGGSGMRVGRDMATYGLRLTAVRRSGLHPWIDAGRFSRPNFDCLPGFPCNDAGWSTRAGLHVPLTSDDGGTGVHAAARAGIGAAFSEEASLSYLLGFLLHWRAVPRFGPLFELRREHVGRINHTVFSVGARVDL